MSQPVPIAPAPTSVERDAQGNLLRPMSSKLMTQLFAVPAMIVAVVVTCAVLVTLLFGWIGVGQQEDVSYLLDKLAAGTGEKVAGFMLLPKDKELWQAAQELANRLQSPDKENITAIQRPEVSQRLREILARTVAQTPYTEATRGRIAFMAIALGHLRDPASIDQFEDMLRSDDSDIRAAGLKGLAWFGPTPASQARAATLIAIVRDDPSPEVRILAAATLGLIGTSGDPRAVAALKDQLVDDTEVRWNAATALARLADLSGKDDLLEMLDRAYWLKQSIKDNPNSDQRRPINEDEISRNLRSTLDALRKLKDADVRAAVEKLTSDSNMEVVKAAKDTLAAMNSAGQQ